MQKSHKKNVPQPKTFQIQGFQLFAREKCYLREFVIAKIRLNGDDSEQINIARCRRLENDSFKLEECFLDHSINNHLKTFHLHDIFLAPTFGLQIEVPKNLGCFELTLNNQRQESQLIFCQTNSGEAFTPDCFIRSEIIS